MYSSHFQSEKLCSTSLRTEYINSGGLFFKGDSTVLPHLVIIYKFKLVLAHEYSIYMMTYNSTLLYILSCVKFSLAIEIFPPSFLFILSASLLSGTTRSSYILFPSPVLESKSSNSLCWKIVLETKIYVLCVFIASAVSLLLGILRGKNKDIYVWILTYIHMHICKYL